MMIDIVHRYTKAVLYHSETAQTVAEAVAEAQKNGSDLRYSDLRGSNLRGSDLSYSDLRYSDLRGSDLRYSNLSYSNLSYSDLRGSDLRGSDLRGSDLSYSDLRGSDLRYSDLRGSDLRGSNLSAGFRIATLCFGGWPVTVTSTETSIGCERHPNYQWLGWALDAPEIAAMHPDAAAWWTRHREAVYAVIRDVMAEEVEQTRRFLVTEGRGDCVGEVVRGGQHEKGRVQSAMGV